MSIDEWAYSLALYAFIRNEDQPEWRNHLSKTVTADFDKCLQYLVDHENEIFQFED